MRTDKINYACDDCKNAFAVFRSDEKARAAGWGIKRGGVICWCPECAPAHRLGGANGKSKIGVRRVASKDTKISKDSITSQELTLIKNFRKLSPYLKKVMLQTVREWTGKEDTESLHKKA